MRKLLVAVLWFASTGPAEASHIKGNGGYGRWLDSALRLLELTEGTAIEPIDVSRYAGCVVADAKLRETLTFLDAGEFCFLEHKLAELSFASADLSWALGEAMKLYRWEFRAGPLEWVYGEVPGGLDPQNLFLIARRSGQGISIDTKLFRALPGFDRVALLFHEVVFALLEPAPRYGIISNFFAQTATSARTVTRVIFSQTYTDAASATPLEQIIREEVGDFMQPRTSPDEVIPEQVVKMYRVTSSDGALSRWRLRFGFRFVKDENDVEGWQPVFDAYELHAMVIRGYTRQVDYAASLCLSIPKSYYLGSQHSLRYEFQLERVQPELSWVEFYGTDLAVPSHEAVVFYKPVVTYAKVPGIVTGVEDGEGGLYVDKSESGRREELFRNYVTEVEQRLRASLVPLN